MPKGKYNRNKKTTSNKMKKYWKNNPKADLHREAVKAGVRAYWERKRQEGASTNRIEPAPQQRKFLGLIPY